MKRIRGVFISVILCILSGLIGWCTASYYHGKSAEDQKTALIESAIHEIQLNLTHKTYTEYQDTAKYRTAGRPFSCLQLGALNELYLNLGVFKDADSSLFVNLERKLIGAKINVETFNQQVSYRNSYILVNPLEVKRFNPGIFRPYYEYVEPSLQELKQFLIDNKESLVR